MAVCKVQLESQARPVSAGLEAGASRGTACVVKCDGVECLGRVIGPRPTPPGAPTGPLAPVVRIATQEDLDRRARHRALETEGLAYFREQVKVHKLAMHPVAVQVAFDESKLFFIYTAENKVDFRDLVRTLAHRFHTRVEMRQVGVRDEARLLGGFGHCGQPLCCSRYLRSFHPVTVRMAKDQGLSLNPAKISGLCGRLMCCLRYEAPERPPKKDAAPAPAPAPAPDPAPPAPPATAGE